MPNYIEFKSKVLDVYDYKNIDISQFAVHFEPDMKQLEKDVLVIQKKHGKTIEAEEVLDGDYVELSCKSENKRYNKESITVIAGKGYFNKELESSMLGMKKREEKELVIIGDKVCVCIGKISRQIIPELTDENVEAWNFEGLKTVKELRKWARDKQCAKFIEEEEYADQAVAYMSKIIADNSSFDLDQGELERTYKEIIKKLQKINEGASSDETTDGEEEEKDEVAPGISSMDDQVNLFKGLYENNLKLAVIGNKLMKEENNLLKLEDYEKNIKKYADYKGISEEEEKNIYTLDMYMKEKYAGYYLDMLTQYATKYLVKKEI